MSIAVLATSGRGMATLSHDRHGTARQTAQISQALVGPRQQSRPASATRRQRFDLLYTWAVLVRHPRSS